MYDDGRSFVCGKHGQVKPYRNGKGGPEGKPTLSCSDCRKEWQQANRPWRAAYSKRYRKARVDELGSWRKIRNTKARAEVLRAYGSRCYCCGETEDRFLCVDHVQNDGAKHRRELGTAGNNLYFWLKSNGFPQDGRFRLLCYNCNNGRQQNGGVCPHEASRLTLAYCHKEKE